MLSNGPLTLGYSWCERIGMTFGQRLNPHHKIYWQWRPTKRSYSDGIWHWQELKNFYHSKGLEDHDYYCILETKNRKTQPTIHSKMQAAILEKIPKHRKVWQPWVDHFLPPGFESLNPDAWGLVRITDCVHGLARVADLPFPFLSLKCDRPPSWDF